MRPQPECPECDKLLSVREDSQKLGYFLEWLYGYGIQLAVWDNNFSGVVWDEEGNEEDFHGTLVPWKYKGDSGINKLLAEYFGINLDKVEQERRELLKWLREVRS